MKRNWLWVILGIIGAVVVAGHLAALAFVGMALSSWVSGTIIGLALVLIAGAHFVLPLHSGGPSSTPPGQVAFWGLGLGVGIVEGYVAGSFLTGLGLWLLVPWALTALGLGMIAGTQKSKAVRLVLFGFASVMLFASTSLIAGTVTDIAMDIGLALVGALGALLIGVAAHLTRTALHPPQKA
ncbi:MAG TPA: hypothetical protein VM285_12015 [Polyangia bacterium]|nr:hypothetical protein [Polyangia bacterium]